MQSRVGCWAGAESSGRLDWSLCWVKCPRSVDDHRVSFPTGVGGLLGLKPPKGFGLSCGVARGNECRGERMVG